MWGTDAATRSNFQVQVCGLSRGGGGGGSEWMGRVWDARFMHLRGGSMISAGRRCNGDAGTVA